MPVAEIAAAITSFRASLDIAKAMIGLRDDEAFRTKAIELQTAISDALVKSIEAREAYSSQLDRVRALEAEITALRDWETERARYRLYSVGSGAMVYMLKPDERGSDPPHWLCPNCFAQGKKSFFQGMGKLEMRRWTYKCIGCNSVIAAEVDPNNWPE